MRLRANLSVLSMSILALAACGGDDSDSMAPASDDARGVYMGPQSAALGATGNQASCSTCHSDDGTQAGFAGSTMKDLAYHDSFKGGEAKTFLDAANACITGWMGGKALEGADAAASRLMSFVEGISSEMSTKPNQIAPEVLEDEAAYEAAYQGGDASAGAAKYGMYCAKCHDAGLVVGGAGALSKATIAALGIGRIAQQVRTSGPPPSGTADETDSTPGPMPFFEPNDLSAQDLKDIIAHLKGS